MHLDLLFIFSFLFMVKSFHGTYRKCSAAGTLRNFVLCFFSQFSQSR